MKLEDKKAGEREDRPTPETDALLSKFFAPCRPAGGTHGQAVGAELWSLRFTGFCRAEFEESVRAIERQRDEAREMCDFNAKQLLVAVNDRNSLGVQLDLLRDELKRIAARIGESGLGDNPYLSHISDYCQRAQKDIAVRYTPIEERDRACERLAVVSLQLDDCKAQRDRLLQALKAVDGVVAAGCFAS